MGYRSLKACIEDLEKHGHLIRITEEVDPNLEMAAIQLRVHDAGGPAILFENVKGTKYRCVSNLFGTMERCRFMFRDSLETVERLIKVKTDPSLLAKNPSWIQNLIYGGYNALPSQSKSKFEEIQISDLPLIKHWPDDGGAFITLPQVYSEDPEKKGWQGSNLGMYRIQLTGNDYKLNEEIGLHYQIHRGIGIHHTKAHQNGEPLKVAIYIGGPPSHTFSAVMPLPEGIPEVTFAGALGGRRWRYEKHDGYVISKDADFVILGEIYPNETKPEGPFGDHLGYYSLTHDFPVMRVKKVLAKKNAIWPFTVVGRPPQEDTGFGNLIHKITGPAVPASIPGLHEVNAVDEAGVHPLLFAVGSERYTPYNKEQRPQELLTIANSILGFGQMSLAKYLFISNKNDNPTVSVNEPKKFLTHILERVDWKRDLHFQTNTTLDTLDYSGDGLNMGSKVVIAASGEKKRELINSLPKELNLDSAEMAMPGVISLGLDQNETIESLSQKVESSVSDLSGLMLMVICDDPEMVAASIRNFLWITFTRSNPANDIYGVGSSVRNKHWGCTGPLIIDARIKPHHAPPLIPDPEVEKRVDQLSQPGASLHGLI
ncbi:MAG: 4-hydroxy-3-polyprenylbenzoate decarboxylase [Bacteroidia bacterium]|jgi:4-hydroxy-3-polyprenylbenzoate decarboxylase